MSAVGIMDLRIDQLRHDQGSTDSMGDVAIVPSLIKSNIRAGLTHGARLSTLDAGAGDAPTGYMNLYYPVKEDIRLGDTIRVTKGPFVDTWWSVEQIVPGMRQQHKEVRVKPYLGKKA